MELNNAKPKRSPKKAVFKTAAIDKFTEIEKKYNDSLSRDLLEDSPTEDLKSPKKSKLKDYDVSDYVQNLLAGYENDLLDSYSETQDQFGKIVDWGNIDVEEIVQRLLVTAEAIAGIRLFPYQKAFIHRIFMSVLLNDGEEITGLWSRQCAVPGTMVRMWDGTVKAVEDIIKGDLLLGDDSKPRTVLETHQGVDDLFRVVPQLSHGEEYVVNSQHILSLRQIVKNRVPGTNKRKPTYKKVDMGVQEYLSLSDYQRNEKLKGYKVGVEWEDKPVDIEPYFLGLWLGDGKSRSQDITTEDFEVVDYIYQYAERLGMKVSKYKYNDRCADYSITHGNTGQKKLNPLRKALQPLFMNKHIPLSYFRNSREKRLQLLAGLIDSDGHRPLSNGKENTAELVFKDARLSKDVVDLARSLGFRATLKTKMATIKSTGYSCEVYRITLYGELHQIPTKIIRKKWPVSKLSSDPLSYGINVEPCGKGEFYGFKVDGNHRFLLEDFTVMHNSGKTESVTVAIVTLMTMLPILAEYFPQLSQFKRGFYVGVFAPTEPQAKTIAERFKLRIKNEMAVEFLSDPEVGLIANDLSLSNGSYVRIHSAAPQARVESKTYHLIVIDEAQDVDEDKVVKSITPMLAATSGTILKIGNPNLKQCEFLQAIKRNMRLEQASRGKVKNHFEFDYKVICNYNERYAKFIEKEKMRYGEDSDFFRMSYKLEWLLVKGMAVSSDEFDKKMKSVSLKLETSPDNRYMYVAGLDLGKKHDSTVLTIGKLVRREHPPRRDEFTGDFDLGEDDNIFASSDLYQKQISNWFEYEGDHWESQIDDIVRVVNRYETLQVLAVDTTGVGDPIFEILSRRLAARDLVLLPVYFSLQTQHLLAQIFYKNLDHSNIIIPSHGAVRKTLKYNRFVRQLLDAEKIWKNDKRIIRHGSYRGAKDDYIQSLFLMLRAAEEALSFGDFSEVPNYFRMDADPMQRNDFDFEGYVDDLMGSFPGEDIHLIGFDNVRKAARAGRLGVKKATFVLK